MNEATSFTFGIEIQNKRRWNMNNRYNTISFCSNDYRKPDPENFSKTYIDEFDMYRDISDFMRIAIKNGYQMKVWFDGLTIVIEYNYKDESLSGVSLEWLDENEYIEKIERNDTDGEDSN